MPNRGHRRGIWGRSLAVAALALVAASCAGGPNDNRRELLGPPPLPAANLSPEIIALANIALDEERYDDASRLIKRVLQLDPDNTSAKLAWAELHLATGVTQDAVRLFDALTLDEDLAARAYQGKGIALLLTGDRDGGFASVQRALAENDMLSRSWSALGYYHDANSNWAEAVDAYDRALALDPDSAETYNNRGFSMMMQQRYGEAVEDLNHALRLDPELSLARENLRLTLAWQGDYAHALSGVAENDLPKTLNNIGFVALLRGDYATATMRPRKRC